MFTEEQQQKIRAEYLDKTNLQLAKELGCSDTTVSRFLKKNNLKLPKDVIAKRRMNGAFKNGNIPFNKGLKWTEYMSDEKIENLRKTIFKKGNKNGLKRNTYDVFYKKRYGERIKHIKIKDGVDIPYQRYVWEQHHGPIPKDHNVIFKDGNTDNCDISNLECISNEEKMLRNSRHKYPKEIIPSMALLCKLNKQLNKK